MKILIIGMLGSGKSTLAYELSRHFSLPRLNLDEVSRDPQTGAYRSDEDCRRLIDEFARRCSDWVAEGSQQQLYRRLSRPDYPYRRFTLYRGMAFHPAFLKLGG